MTGPSRVSERRPLLTVTIIAVLPLLYVLSYAPVVRVMGGTKTVPTVTTGGHATTIAAPICGTTLPFYRPVDWLIDNTPLKEPLFKWAELWGVRHVFAEATFWR